MTRISDRIDDRIDLSTIKRQLPAASGRPLLVHVPVAVVYVPIGIVLYATTVSLSTRPFAFVAVAIGLSQHAVAVGVAVAERAVVHVAVLEVEASHAGHDVLAPLAHILEAAIARHHHVLARHEALDCAQLVAQPAYHASATVREHTRARALLVIVDKVALVRVATRVLHHAVALLAAAGRRVAREVLLGAGAELVGAEHPTSTTSDQQQAHEHGQC